MKTLIVYIKEGQLVITQTNAIKQYSCIVEDVEENKELTDKILDLKAGSRTCARNISYSNGKLTILSSDLRYAFKTVTYNR